MVLKFILFKPEYIRYFRLITYLTFLGWIGMRVRNDLMGGPSLENLYLAARISLEV